MKTADIKPGQVWRVDPPNYYAMITGVASVGFFPDARVVLKYEDGATEEARFTAEEADALMVAAEDSILPVVSAVQGRRVGGIKV